MYHRPSAKRTVLLNLGIQRQRTVYELAPNSHLGLKARLWHSRPPCLTGRESCSRAHLSGLFPGLLTFLPLTSSNFTSPTFTAGRCPLQPGPWQWPKGTHHFLSSFSPVSTLQHEQLWESPASYCTPGKAHEALPAQRNCAYLPLS